MFKIPSFHNFTICGVLELPFRKSCYLWQIQSIQLHCNHQENRSGIPRQENCEIYFKLIYQDKHSREKKFLLMVKTNIQRNPFNEYSIYFHSREERVDMSSKILRNCEPPRPSSELELSGETFSDTHTSDTRKIWTNHKSCCRVLELF